jgi:hypothetical protein
MFYPRRRKIVHVLGLCRAGKTTLVMKLTQRRTFELDLLGDLHILARHARDLYDPETIVCQFLEKPYAFDSERLMELFYSRTMQCIYKGRNQLKGIHLSSQLEYIIPNLPRLLTQEATPLDRLHGYRPSIYPRITTYKHYTLTESIEPIAIKADTTLLVVSLLDYYEVVAPSVALC